MSFQAGSVTAVFSAKIEDLTNKMKGAGRSLEEFGSKGKKLEDTLKNLERRKQLVVDKMNLLERAGQKNTGMYNSLKVGLEGYNDKINTHNLKIGEFINKSQKTNSVLGTIGAGFSNLGKIGSKAMSSLFGSITRVAEIALGNLLAMGIAKASQGFRLLFGGAVDKAAEAQKAFTTLEIISPRFGQSAERAKQIAKDLSKSLNLDLGASAEGLQNLLKSGLNLDQASDLMKRFTNEAITGKSSSISLSEAVQNLSFAYTTGNSALGNLSGISENFSDIEERGAKMMGKKLSAMSDTEKMQARYKGMIALTNLTLGSAEKFEGSYIDTTAKKDLVLANISRTIGERLMPAMSKLNELIINNGPKIEAMAMAFVDFGFKSIEAIKQIPEYFERFKQKLGELKQFIVDTATAIATYFKPELDLLKQMFDVFSNQVLPFIIANLAILAGVFVWIGANVITALIYAWEQLREPVMQFALALMEVWAVIAPVATVILGLVGVLLVALMPALQIVFSYVVQVFSGILQVVTGVINFVVGIIKTGIGLIYGIFTGDFRMAGEGFKQIWNGLVQFVSGVWTMMKAPVVAIIDGIKNTFKSINLIQAGKDAIQGFINGISGMAGQLKEKVDNLANSVKDGIKNALKISSPSKLMMQYGEWTGQGLAMGIDNSQRDVATSSANLAMATTAPIANNTVNQSNSFNISGTQNPQGIVQEVVRTLSRMNNLANSGVGQAI